MNPDDITKTFEAFLAGKGIAPEQVTPPQAIDLMVEFHGSVRFDWVEKNHQDADMLLFQYGVYDWGQGENFEVNITRQLMGGLDEDGDHELYQLGLTLFYKPEKYKGISMFGKWSMDSGTIAEYVNEIKATEGYLRACLDIPTGVEIFTQLVG